MVTSLTATRLSLSTMMVGKAIGQSTKKVKRTDLVKDEDTNVDLEAKFNLNEYTFVHKKNILRYNFISKNEKKPRKT